MFLSVVGSAFCDNDESERVHVRTLLAMSDAEEHNMIWFRLVRCICNCNCTL